MTDSKETPATHVEQTGTYEMLWDCRYCGTGKLLGIAVREPMGARWRRERKYYYRPKSGRKERELEPVC